MASKTKVTAQKEEVPPDTEGPATPPDSPLLDLADGAVKKLIRAARKCGYVTHEQINAVLPSDEANSEQIEDLLSMFSEIGVNVVENDEAESKEEGAPEEPEDEPESESELVPTQPKLPAGARVFARDGHGGSSLAGGRDRNRQAHRGRARGHDRGPVRESADLPGGHHLARPAQ
jgi:hypothetical protein